MSQQEKNTITISIEEYNLLKSTNEQLLEKNSRMEAELFHLKHQLKQLQRMVFGAKSERFVAQAIPDQVSLGLGQGQQQESKEDVQTEEVHYTRRKKSNKQAKGHGRELLPAHLPRKEIIIEPENIPEGSVKIGEEVTETLEMAPSRFFVLREVRIKYALPGNQGVIIAPKPEQVFPKCKAGLSLIVYILVSKYVDHLPLYRLIQQFRRQKVDISESTMTDWVRESILLLAILHERLRELIRASDYLQGDETPIPVLTEDKEGATHKGYLWVFHDPLKHLVLFDYHKGRDHLGADKILNAFIGAFQTDGYTAYDVYEREGETMLLGCMAHLRRRFEKAKDQDKERSDYMMALFGKLYQVERQAREAGMDFGQRKALRMEKSLPVLQEMEAWMKENLPQVLPKSAIGDAITYAMGQWKWILRYLEDGRYEIDNNLIENTIRPVALGRKNYMFAGSHEAAQRTAIIYSLLGSCKLNGINPTEWLTDVLTRIKDTKRSQLEELLPHIWKPINTQIGV